MPGRTVAIDTYKIDAIAESVHGIRQMQDEIRVLEIMQNNPDEAQRPGQAWIVIQKLVMNAAMDMCDNQLRSLSPEELTLLGTRFNN